MLEAMNPTPIWQNTFMREDICFFSVNVGLKQITLARLKNVAKKLLAITKSSHSRHEDSR